LTWRAIHKLEQDSTDPRRTTVPATEEAWRERGVEFEDLADCGLRASVRSLPLDRPVIAPSRRHANRVDLGDTNIGPLADSPRLRARPGFLLLTLQGAPLPRPRCQDAPLAL
jgi:hypothetical protein